MTVEELEGRRRKDIEEALIKRDIKRQKVAEAHDAPGAVAQQLGLDEDGPRRRGKLMLPAPQVGVGAHRWHGERVRARVEGGREEGRGGTEQGGLPQRRRA